MMRYGARQSIINKILYLLTQESHAFESFYAKCPTNAPPCIVHPPMSPLAQIGSSVILRYITIHNRFGRVTN